MSGEIRASVNMDPLPPMEGTPGPTRKLGNGRQSPTSPLKLFGQARKKINDIYLEILSYVTESDEFILGVDTEDNTLIAAESIDKVNKYITKVNGIREILSRDRMKVAFFGRTSNGKSTVINAMLKTKILPSGIGHTTNCFVQVEGTDESEAFVMTEDQTHRNIQDVRQLANALSKVRLDPDSLVRICWPKHKMPLLKDDVVLVDSPGVDVSPDIDNWINKFCLDADVFVLVANAESTLMQTEKNFFHRVSERLSKPNIFVINNRWDASASEQDTMEEVRKQHMERSTHFLVEELKVIDSHEAEDRIFFVSAREALVSRANQEAGTPTPTGQLMDGFQGRLFEFASFERKFEECISHSAVQTKFAQHTANGRIIIVDIKNVMKELYDSGTQKRDQRILDQEETKDKLDFTDKQLNMLTSQIKDKIKQMTDEVERKVSTALSDEIRRLAVLVDEFERPFHPDLLLLTIYKKELHDHVEVTVGRNLQTRCSTALKTVVEDAQSEMTERLTALLPEDTRQQAANLLPSREFEMAYRLDCRNLCADFKEDIEFRFSLGMTSLMNRFVGAKGTQAILTGHGSIPRPLNSAPQTPSCETAPNIQEGEVMVALLGTFTSLYSRTTIGALAITGLIAKAAGWRILGVCGAFYGMLYLYERLTWTSQAKEKTFKRQYVDYATSKLKLIVDLTSANCSHQVQQELSSTFARLCHQVDITKGELEEELKRLGTDIEKLEQIATRANFMRNKAGYLDSELNTFVQQYLLSNSLL